MSLGEHVPFIILVIYNPLIILSNTVTGVGLMSYMNLHE